MKRLSYAALLGACLVHVSLAQPVQAEPGSTEEVPLFHCGFANGKSVTLDAGIDGAGLEGLRYRFGRPGKMPELEVFRPYEEVRVTPWPGVGRSIWEDLSLTNGDYSYRIWGSLDKEKAVEEAADALAGGVIVEQGEHEIARLDCLPESVSYTVFSFADTYAEAGYCWDFEHESWRRDEAGSCP
ncbi:hypothetical protein [Celeribacter neptunius]|uniref:Uncharacterized protein n=1 Tax=Celeribacter neptunius TaxID=588602 RepID=A0A1I3IPJ8_9RHOB|nr:hypothetical protein [Celeribacter neptunius]SFI49693.1 hypothetical protein SAMN04487991_0086 [Celeribacter neptunius]